MRILVVFFTSLGLTTACQAQPTGSVQVCASGCEFSDLQQALNQAQPGARIVLKAGETFRGNFRLPNREVGAEPIIIESSDLNRLPPAGVRVQAADAKFMPKLVPQDPASPVLRASDEERYVDRLDPGTDTVHFAGRHNFAPTERIAFWMHEDVPNGLETNKPYFVKPISDTAIQVSESIDGPPVDLRDAPKPRYFRVSSLRVGNGYTLRGIELSASATAPQHYGLVEIGGTSATAREGLPTDIRLEHVYIHGLPGSNGPRICLTINARKFEIEDSRLEHCNKEGEESKGILMVMAPGPGLIRNNYVEGGSINLLMGGDFVRIKNLVSGDLGGIEITGNHFHKPLSLKYTAGTGGNGNPSGGCASGWYLNAVSGQWFVCDNGQWRPGPECAPGEYFRRTDVQQKCDTGACWECSVAAKFVPSNVYRGYHYFVKNLFEVKSGMNLNIHGNVFENNWVNGDQSGVGVWLVSQVSADNATGWVRGENILFTNNILHNSSQGIRVASEGGNNFGYSNRGVRVVNNLLYDIGRTATPSIASNDARPISFAGDCVDCAFVHNTVVSGVPSGAGVYFDTKPVENFRFTNNIGHYNGYGFIGDGAPASQYLKSSVLQNNILIAQNPGGQFAPGRNQIVGSSTRLFAGEGIGASQFRLHLDSPFSAGCASGCQYAGDDGTDLGADIDRIEEETSGAVAGTPSWSREVGLQVASVTQDRAILEYSVRDGSVCSLRASTNSRLRDLIPDLQGEGNDLDHRPGNFVDGDLRRFVIGSNLPLQPGTRYYFRLACGEKHQSGTFQTEPATARRR